MSEYINPEFEHVSRHQAVTDVIESIALEEKSIAGILCIEAKKIEAVINSPLPCIEDLKDINESVCACIQNIIKLQMLMEFKLNAIKKLIGESDDRLY